MLRIKKLLPPPERISPREALTFVFARLTASCPVFADHADIREHGSQWTMRTSRMECVVALEDGRLVLKSFTEKTTGRELVTSGTP